MIAIDVDRVDRVMIGGVWWTVHNDSFEIDRYMFVLEGSALTLDPGPAFQFQTRHPVSGSFPGQTITMSGPIAAIEMIEHRPTGQPVAIPAKPAGAAGLFL